MSRLSSMAAIAALMGIASEAGFPDALTSRPRGTRTKATDGTHHPYADLKLPPLNERKANPHAGQRRKSRRERKAARK